MPGLGRRLRASHGAATGAGQEECTAGARTTGEQTAAGDDGVAAMGGRGVLNHGSSFLILKSGDWPATGLVRIAMLRFAFRPRPRIPSRLGQQTAHSPAAKDLLLAVDLLYPESRVCQVRGWSCAV